MIDRNKIFAIVTAGAGLTAAYLRGAMMETLESQGLLPQGSLHAAALWVLTFAFMAFLFLFSMKTGENGEYSQAFPPCNIRLGLGLAGGVLMVAAGIRTIAEPTGAACCLAGAAMTAGAVYRRQDSAPLPLLHILVCLNCLYRLITSFRSWSADPQLHDYVIQLVATTCLMLFACFRANCDAGRIRRRATGVLGLLAAYFSMAALSDPQPAFYLASALWAISAVPSMEQLQITNEEL